MFDGRFIYGNAGRWHVGLTDPFFKGSKHLSYGTSAGHCAKDGNSKDDEKSQNIHPIPEGSKVSDQKTQGKTLPPKPRQISWNLF